MPFSIRDQSASGAVSRAVQDYAPVAVVNDRIGKPIAFISPNRLLPIVSIEKSVSLVVDIRS